MHKYVACWWGKNSLLCAWHAVEGIKQHTTACEYSSGIVAVELKASVHLVTSARGSGRNTEALHTEYPSRAYKAPRWKRKVDIHYVDMMPSTHARVSKKILPQCAVRGTLLEPGTANVGIARKVAPYRTPHVSASAAKSGYT